MLRNHIFSFAVHHVHEADGDKGKARNTSTRELLDVQMEQEQTIKFLKAWAAVYKFLGGFVAPRRLGQGFSEMMQFPKFVGPYLLTVCGWSPQTKHNRFEHDRLRNPGYFLLVSGEENTSVSVRPDLYEFLHN